MPSQKRVYESGDEDLQENDKESSGEEEDEDGEDSDQGDDSSSSEDEPDEFILVRLSDIRKEVQCPICLGIIKKTRTVMECLHRFCRECIDKSMRLGNNECPACRTHCASRRSLRDDPNYDALIAALYPDIDQYEEEELAFHEEEKARNRQIQASIAQTFKRQSEALSKKRRRSQGNTRRRRNFRSEDDEDANVHDGKESSSADERPTEVRMRRPKRWRGQPSSAAGSGDAAGAENDSELNRESGIGSGGLVGTSDMLVWGRGGMRSHTRYGSGSGSNGKHARNSRLAKLVDHMRNLDENDNELDMHLVLISVDEQKVPGLEHPYVCCKTSLSVGQLCEYISSQTSLGAEEIDILAVKELQPRLTASTLMEGQLSGSTIIDECKDEFQRLDFNETLTQVKAKCFCSRGYLTLAYRQKLQ